MEITMFRVTLARVNHSSGYSSTEKFDHLKVSRTQRTEITILTSFRTTVWITPTRVRTNIIARDGRTLFAKEYL